MTRREQLSVAAAPTLEVRLPAGSVRLLAGEAGSVTVEIAGPDAEQFRVEQRGTTVVCAPEGGGLGRWRSFDLTVTVPPGTTLHTRLASAELSIEPALARLEADVASGRLRAGDVAGDVRVKSASGDVGLGHVRGTARVTTASGDIDIARLEGDAKVHSASGDVRLGRVDGPLGLKTASGDVRILAYAGSDLECTAMSGDLEVGIPGGRSLDVDLETLSGAVRNDFDVVTAEAPVAVSGRARVRLRSLSGDVALVRARGGDEAVGSAG